MTSKDKLIEFLKSTNLEWHCIHTAGKIEVELELTIFVFNVNGEFLEIENY